VLPTYNTYVTHTYYFSALIIRLVGLVVSFFLKPWSQARGCQEVQKVDCVGVSRASDTTVVMAFLLGCLDGKERAEGIMELVALCQRLL
jgi:hypothetical protein